ncbi:MAG TPA: hypothetical protein VKA15_01570 [Isosphaeraceae bacterium]|nr:hypothetical protein [Isosphaeraceae bacterium]
MNRTRWLLAGGLLLWAMVDGPGCLPLLAQAASPAYSERWVYCGFNLQVEKSADELATLCERAAKAGYTGIVLSDYKLQILDRVPDFYFRNAERVKASAARAGIEIIPAVFSIGYSNGHLAHDPNLAEGLPVVDQLYVVKEQTGASMPVRSGAARRPSSSGSRLRVAVLDSRTAQIPNGGLEETQGDRILGFSLQDDPGVTTFVDREIKHAGKVSLRVEPGTKDSRRSVPLTRLARPVALRPNTPYRFSCWVKTRDLGPTGGFHLLALGTGRESRQLTFHEGGIERNQDWKQIEVVFNSLDQREANLYVGLWETGPGTYWVDDLKLEELALVNVLRRNGCPVTVKSGDGRTTYVEGRDFEPVVDSQLGQVPWPGEYEFGHPGPTIKLTGSSRIKTGDRLRVSWYHPVITHSGQMMCCLSEPKLEPILRDQARRINQLFHPRTFFMSHDEIRVANWCQACRDRKMTPGQLLAENVKTCAGILKAVNPRARVVVWSDMFDPHHNAVDKYYLINGSLKGSWEGLPRDVIIANWNSGKARESLAFFAGLGHRQLIAGFYDASDLSNFEQWHSAARGVSGVMGFMYTTWQGKYDLLEKYGEAMRGP